MAEETVIDALKEEALKEAEQVAKALTKKALLTPTPTL